MVSTYLSETDERQRRGNGGIVVHRCERVNRANRGGQVTVHTVRRRRRELGRMFCTYCTSSIVLYVGGVRHK